MWLILRGFLKSRAAGLASSPSSPIISVRGAQASTGAKVAASLLLMGSSWAEPWGSLSGQGGQAGAQGELLPSQGSPDGGIFGVVAVERPSHRGQARGELPRQPQWMRVLGGAPGTGGSEHTEAGVMGVGYPSFPGSAGLVPWFWRAEGT